MGNLTAVEVKSASNSGRSPLMVADGGGLYLRVAPSGSKSWILRYQLNGKRRDMGLGAFPAVSLAEARTKAATQAALAKNSNVDPVAQRQAEREAAAEQARQAQVEAARESVTFAKAATAYVDAQAPGWKNAKHVDQWRNTLATYCAPFGSKPVDAVTVDDVEAALRPLWLSKTETATRLLQRIVLVVAYAHDKGWRQSDDAEGWPMRLRRRLPRLPKKTERVEHHPALPYKQLPAFMAALRASRATGSRALELGVLCASRSGEVRHATWGEFDLDAALWVIPASRMKAKVEHRVPLSTQAVELLRSIRPETVKPTDYVFPSRKDTALSDMTLSAFIRRQNEKELKWKDERGEAVVPHGFRSTFSDWTSECTAFPADVREMALAHTIENKVEAAYRRGDLFDKRRDLMQQWADFCCSDC